MLFFVTKSSNIISEASSCFHCFPGLSSLVRKTVNFEQCPWRNLQCYRDEQTVPYMRKRTVAKIVTQAGKLNALDVPVCNSKLWLLGLEMLDHTPSHVRNA